MGKDGKKKGVVGQLIDAYLFYYNLACCIGWAVVLKISLEHIQTLSFETNWGSVEAMLKIVQTAAVMEIFHAIIGFVRSPVGTTFMQVFSRVWTLWAVMHISPEAQTSVFFTLACTSWALVEVPRYLFYSLNIIDAVPYPLFWLRYSLFAVLYPTGITGELGCMYMSILTLKGKHEWSAIPRNDMILLALIVLVVITYIPGSPKMYKHMVKNRKKQFAIYNGEDVSSDAKKKKTK